MKTITIQELWTINGNWNAGESLPVASTDLHRICNELTGDPSPSGRTEINIEALLTTLSGFNEMALHKQIQVYILEQADYALRDAAAKKAVRGEPLTPKERRAFAHYERAWYIGEAQ